MHDTTTTLPLHGGHTIPTLGLGVWQMTQSEETEQAIMYALSVGYRHIDTAKLYGNEESVGKAIQQSTIPREEIFVTTKLWPTDAFSAETALQDSLKRLGLAYVDLYLIHWPIPLFGDRVWKQMETLAQQGLARNIGVSNYSRTQMEELLEQATIPPAVHQIECNPFTYDRKLIEFCQQHNIVVEAYSPLTRGLHLDDATIVKLAMHYAKTPAQIMLRWALQKGTVVIPKSSNKARITENADIFSFSISADDMRRLDALSH
ncbi:MAG: hypothetical protein QG621_642 [Patescibacteria group bacterium]|nr:hypothetical protein [Patescibacteria group bacterium]